MSVQNNTSVVFALLLSLDFKHLHICKGKKKLLV